MDSALMYRWLASISLFVATMIVLFVDNSKPYKWQRIYLFVLLAIYFWLAAIFEVLS